MRSKTLIVDDDPTVIRFLRANLKASGYETYVAANGAEALELIEKEIPDLVILDIMMPRMDGMEVCRRLREWSHIAIIMLSARGDVLDKVRCLELGADDYLTKPFGIEELLARVKAVLRRISVARAGSDQPTFTCDNIQVNFVERRVTIGGHEVKLTPIEYSLLQELVLNANKVLTHRMLLGRVWGPEYGDETQYLHVFIGNLRRQLEYDPRSPKHIVTVSGVGYQFKLESTSRPTAHRSRSGKLNTAVTATSPS